MAYKGTPPKMTTKEYNSRITARSFAPGKCWEAVLKAFDVKFTPTGKRQHGEVTRQMLVSAGWKLTPVNLNAEAPGGFPVTLAVFMHNHGRHGCGDYIVSTAGHVLCVRDGEITDTAFCSVKRLVLQAYAVTPEDSSWLDMRHAPARPPAPPLVNPYADVITWLKTQEGRRWQHTVMRKIQHTGSAGGVMAFASLKPLDDAGLPWRWYNVTGNPSVPHHVGPEYTGKVVRR